MIRITSIVKGARKFVVDNSPAILTGMAVAGVVTTTILAVKATPQAMQEISEAESEFTDLLTVNQKIFLVGHCYMPAVASGLLTVGCIVMANSINTKRQAALISAFSISETAFKEYQQKVADTVGEAKEQRVRDSVAQDVADRNPISDTQVYVTGDGNHLFHDTLSGRYFESSVEKVRRAENRLNAKLINEMYASQNDFYSMIGLDAIKYGDDFGWTTDRFLDLSFSTVLVEESRPCIVVNYSVEPARGYHKFG